MDNNAESKLDSCVVVENYIFTDFCVADAVKTNERLICVRQRNKSNRESFSKFYVCSSICHSDIAIKKIILSFKSIWS